MVLLRPRALGHRHPPWNGCGFVAVEAVLRAGCYRGDDLLRAVPARWCSCRQREGRTIAMASDPRSPGSAAGSAPAPSKNASVWSCCFRACHRRRLYAIAGAAVSRAAVPPLFLIDARWRTMPCRRRASSGAASLRDLAAASSRPYQGRSPPLRHDTTRPSASSAATPRPAISRRARLCSRRCRAESNGELCRMRSGPDACRGDVYRAGAGPALKRLRRLTPTIRLSAASSYALLLESRRSPWLAKELEASTVIGAMLCAWSRHIRPNRPKRRQQLQLASWRARRTPTC